MVDNNLYELQSKTIDWLRFPLIVMVVFMHNQGLGDFPESVNVWGAYSLSSTDYLNLVRMTFTKVIPTIAVPTFFVISGYLFFFRVDIFRISLYWEKLKKRTKTLLVPYVLWNFIWLVMPILYNYSLGWHNSQHYIYVRSYVSSVDWIRWIWDFSFINQYDLVNLLGIVRDGTYPINYPLWYVRDLMIICLLTPAIYWLIKKAGLYFLFILATLHVFGVWPNIHGLDLTGLFYFCVGAFFSLNKKNMVSVFRKVEIPCYCLVIVLLCFLIPNSNYKIGVVYMSVFFVMVGVVSAFNISSRIVASGKKVMNKWLTKSVFFIFAFHTTIIVRVGIELIFPYDDVRTVTILEYLITPFIAIAICLAVYWLLGKVMPRVLKVLMGNR